ncbi:MAG: phosphoribosylanthranilate isomerase [Candidatus Aenigmatarchaeota archaeon]
MKVKICGIKTAEELKSVILSGADAVGFISGITHKSEDAIQPEEVRNLSKLVPPLITPVLVTHLTSLGKLFQIIITAQVFTVQLQGDISPENIRLLKQALPYAKFIKAIHVVDRSAIEKAKEYENVVDAILLDSKTSDRLGGIGLTHDWNISAEIAKTVKVPIILAGGLNPDNVKEAINKVKPFGVDVNTGVKGLNGYKDPEKVKLFVEIAKNANSTNYRIGTH